MEDLEQALHTQDGAAVHGLLEGLHAQSRRMSRMLSDLLTYARIGRNEELIEDTDLAELVDAIVRSLPRPAALVVAVAGDWPRMQTAGTALDLVLRNLIDNAIKHHDRDEGRIEVRATLSPPGLVIEVADDGPGIAPAHHAAIFQPFRRLGEEPDDEAATGSGIGLALVRKTVELAGATVDLASDPAVQRGATFTLIWPARIVA